MAALLGLNPWATPLDLWLAKVGQSPPREDSPAMYWGRQLEDLVAKEFARQTGYTVRRRTQMLRHPTIPYLIGHLDRITRDNAGLAVLECKTTGAHGRRDWEDGQAPAHYLVQVQHYLDLTGYARGYLAVLIGGQDFRIVPVQRNEALIAEMHAAAEAFWPCVESGTPPLIDGSQASAAALKLLYPASDGSTITLPDESRHWIAQRQEAEVAKKEAEDRKTEAENRLKSLLGTAEVGLVDGYRVAWRPVTRKSLDAKAFQAAHPDLAAQFERESTFRTLTIKEVPK